MLRLIIVIQLILWSLVRLSGQTSVGIDGGTLTVVPSHTVVNGSTYVVNGLFKNTGNTTIFGYVHLNLAIDTSSTSTPQYSWRSTITYSVTNFLPAATHTFAVGDIASTANAYKVGGNGTTVIVWPIAGTVTNTITTHDTASTIIYIFMPGDPTGIEEFEATPINLKNPVNDDILLNYNSEIYDKVELVSLNGQVIVNAVQEHVLRVTDCSKGLYFLRFYNRSRTIVVTKKIIIE